MSSKEQSVTLLRRNKRSQVDAFRAVGMTLDYDCKASEFARRILWAGGVLDITVAAVRKYDHQKVFYTKDEWLDLTVAERALVVPLGVRVRAFGKQFLVAAGDAGMKRWATNGVISGMDYRVIDNMSYMDEKGDTDKVINTKGSEDNAFRVARDFRAFHSGDEADLDFDDDTVWSVPTQAHLQILYKIKTQINTVLSAVWDSSVNIQNAEYWSTSHKDSGNAWYTKMGNGTWNYAAKSSSYRVRPISTL